MRVETLVILLFSIVLTGALLWVQTISWDKKDKSSLAEEMCSRPKENMPNRFVEYSGEQEKKDTEEYKKIIDGSIISLFRHEDDNNAGK